MMSRLDKPTTQIERIFVEKLEVLSGQRGSEDAHAVRKSDLATALEEVYAEIKERSIVRQARIWRYEAQNLTTVNAHNIVTGEVPAVTFNPYQPSLSSTEIPLNPAIVEISGHVLPKATGPMSLTFTLQGYNPTSATWVRTNIAHVHTMRRHDSAVAYERIPFSFRSLDYHTEDTIHHYSKFRLTVIITTDATYTMNNLDVEKLLVTITQTN